MRRMILLLALSLATALPAAAQVHGGSITGTVKDTQGGVLPGATITAQGVDATLSITTTSDGAYHFLDLAPGSYKITSALSGFRTTIRDSVEVEVGKTVDVPFSLQVASVAETITVDASAPMVNATPVGTATNFTNDELNNIPTSRDPFGIIRSVPGVLTDRVNAAGGETGQQLLVLAKGGRQQDTSWTLDGVEITDMAAPGQSAVYFNFDDFDEIHVGTAGNDIRERTGALNIDLSVKRGGNQFHGDARGYFGDTGLQANNVPLELTTLATPVTTDTADHVTKSSDWGLDMGGPLLRDRAWFYGSFSEQNIGVFRRTTKSVDTTKLDNPNVKINVQATKKDLVNFLWYNGYKIKDNRTTGVGSVSNEQPAATFHQDNQYSDSPFHGLWKLADDRVFGPHLLASAKYAYFNTGIALTPEGGMDAQAGRNVVTSTNYGSVQRNIATRPQHTATLDLDSFFHALGASHDLKFGGGYRTTDTFTEQLWPGNGILAIVQTTTDLRAQVYREGNGGNRADYLDFYAGDTVSKNRATVDFGVRYDRQWGFQDASTSQANPLFPALLPGIVFPGGRAPFTWTNFSPRVGLSYALDNSGKTVARVTYSQFAGQLPTSAVGYTNTASGLASMTFRWTDLNGDGFVNDASEVNTAITTASASGINAANPTSNISTNTIDPNLKAPVTKSIVVGIERELMSNLAVSATYTYNRTTNLFGNEAANITDRVGMSLSDYTPNGGLIVGKPTGGTQQFANVFTGTLPDGTPFSIPIFNANAQKFIASAGGFNLANVPGYYVDYNGVDVGLTKRMSNKWMAHVSFGYNNAREHFTDPAGIIDNDGNPMPTVTEPLVNGGQYVGATGTGSGSYYLNAKWQINANGMYVAPYGIELAANVFGRQGYPFPIFATAGINTTGTGGVVGAETLRLLVTPTVDYFRYPNVWDTDFRIAKGVKYQGVSIKVMADVFNLLNANTALLRNNDITSSTFNALTQNMTPRLVRFGVTIGF
jgi:hypothetical protein